MKEKLISQIKESIVLIEEFQKIAKDNDTLVGFNGPYDIVERLPKTYEKGYLMASLSSFNEQGYDTLEMLYELLDLIPILYKD